MSTHIKWKNAFIALFACILLSAGASAQEVNPASFPVDIRTSWFKPFLVEDHNKICQSFLKHETDRFFSQPQRFPNGIPSNEKFESLDWAPRELLFEEQPDGSVVRKPLKIESNNVYIRSFIDRGCGGGCEGSHWSASLKPFPDTNSYGESSEGHALELGPTQETESEPANYGDDLPLMDSSGNAYVVIRNTETKLYQLRSDATWQNVCEVSYSPSSNSVKAFEYTTTSISQLNQNLQLIMGEEGSFCGSLHALSQAKKSLTFHLNRSILQPWALNVNIFDEARHQKTRLALKNWALLDPYNKRTFDAFEKQFKVTSEDLSNFYQSLNHWPKKEADQIAEQALNAALDNSFFFSSNETLINKNDNLHNAITNNSSLSEIKTLLKNNNILPEDLLAGAIHRPEIIQLLLENGINPNIQNPFGKSALMYAAQFNEIETAKNLIKFNGDPNLFTTVLSYSCEYKLDFSGMTALHYAIRYASKDFIKLLLNNGANPYAKTSEYKNSYPIDWLHKYTYEFGEEVNKNIKKDEIAELEKLLRLPEPEEITKMVLNYNLQAEKQFQNKEYKQAYDSTKRAINLDSDNGRGLANLSLIALKMNNTNEAMEAAIHLTTSKQDNSQVANAWYNLGLICRNLKTTTYYNGRTYCDSPLFYYFLNAYQANSTKARAETIVKTLTSGESKSCYFKELNLYITGPEYNFGSYRKVYLLSPKNSNVTSDQLTWKTSREVKQADNSIKKIEEMHKPEKLVDTIELGDYTLRIFGGNETINTPLYFDGKICSNNQRY